MNVVRRPDGAAGRGGSPYARFDAVGAPGRSFTFHGLAGEVEARDPDEVVPVLRAVEQAVASGLHAAGFLAYEAAPGIDPTLATHPSRPDLPLAWFGLFRERREVGALAGLPDAGPEPEIGPWSRSLPPGEYARRVAAIHERIAAGETYQANLTFRLDASYAGTDAALYRATCSAQRAGYCALLRGAFGSVVSASPELFFRWTGEELELRPMKGTRPRGRWLEEDVALAEELLASEKERAENLMIVDLLRNDVGRVARFGSVSVPELFTVERYPTVLQLTSAVRARARPGVGLVDVLRALFPSGSVTGAPKVSTMRILRALEDHPRGVYTGAIGFVSPGEAVFSVPIRTLLLPAGRGSLEMGVGSGITIDAEAAAEYAECLQKAEFVRAGAPAVRLLETMRYDPGRGFPLLEGHLRRLARSAAYFGIPVDPEEVRRRLRAAVAGDGGGSLRVRLLVGEDGEVRVERSALAEAPPLLRARLAAEPVDSRSRHLYHKTTARDLYRSRLAAHPGFDDVLLRNERGEVTEFTTGNLVVVLDGAAWTPPLSAGLLPGVMREALLRAGEVRERVLVPADVLRAEAVYLTNAVRGRVRVELVS
jgi:para-aminobenzoate synthetase / 4-amino-4-deoxychorismate lyase